MRKAYTASIFLFVAAAAFNSVKASWALDIEIGDRVTNIVPNTGTFEIQFFRSAATYHINTDSPKSDQLLRTLRASLKRQSMLKLKVNSDTLEIVAASSK